MADIATIVDTLSKLTIIEAADLVKKLETAWGVSAAAPVAVAPQGGGGGATAAGKLTRIPFMWVWLRLTIIKLASRKNMMSINGMISMRARLCGIGEDNLIFYIFVRQDSVRRAGHREGNRNLNLGNCSRFKSPLPKRAGGGVV